jgi:hypothetical protein
VQKAEQAMKVRRLKDQFADMESKYMEAQELVETQQENTSGSFVPFSAFWLM